MDEKPVERKPLLLSAGVLEDDKGNTFISVIDAELARAERRIQEFMDDNGGEPPQKAVEITIKLELKAEGETRRRVLWGTKQKAPQLEKLYSQFASNREGSLEMDRPARQGALPFTLEKLNMKELIDDGPGSPDQD